MHRINQARKAILELQSLFPPLALLVYEAASFIAFVYCVFKLLLQGKL